MTPEDELVSLKDIADRAQVRLSAVSNWRSRYSSFPTPENAASGKELFRAHTVGEWLRGRTIPRNRLLAGEPPGISYGDRFLRGFASRDTTVQGSTGTAEPIWRKVLWRCADQLRANHDVGSAFELLLALVYTRVFYHSLWESMVNGTATSAQLEGPTLIGPEGKDAPLFSTPLDVDNPAVRSAIRLLHTVDFGKEGSSSSVGARMSTVILANIERYAGKSGGHFTPPDVAHFLVELLGPPSQQRVFDPFCGSGELLAAAADRYGRSAGTWSGQPLDAWSWRTSSANLALHGIGARLAGPGLALYEDPFPSEKFDLVITNPPFNQKLDPMRLTDLNASFARNSNLVWAQYVAAKLSKSGRGAIVMPAGAAFGSGDRDASARAALLDAGVLECVVALPPGLFMFTSVPVMVWLLRAPRDPSSVLIIDAGDLGEPVGNSKRRLTPADIQQIVREHRRWREGPRAFRSTPGFSRVVGREELWGVNDVLVPQRLVRSESPPPSAANLYGAVVSRRRDLDLGREQANATDAQLADALESVNSLQEQAREGTRTSLGEVCDVLSGPGMVVRDENSPGKPLVLPRNIKNLRIEDGDVDTLPAEYEKKFARYRLHTNDIITTRTGTLGRFGLVEDRQSGWFLGPGCTRLRQTAQVDMEYLTFYLSGPTARSWLDTHATGSAVQQITAATFREMPLWLPPPDTQRDVVAILRQLQSTAMAHAQVSTQADALRDAVVALLAPGSQ